MNLQYIKENFTGIYVPRTEINTDPMLTMVLAYLQKDPGYTEEQRVSLADGMMSLDLKISPSPDFEFELIDNNRRMFRFHINDIVPDRFWFTDFEIESIASYKDDTLIIETTQASPARKVTYKFHEYYINNNDPSSFRRDIIFEMFITGITSWSMIYEIDLHI